MVECKRLDCVKSKEKISDLKEGTRQCPPRLSPRWLDWRAGEVTCIPRPPCNQIQNVNIAAIFLIVLFDWYYSFSLF